MHYESCPQHTAGDLRPAVVGKCAGASAATAAGPRPSARVRRVFWPRIVQQLVQESIMCMRRAIIAFAPLVLFVTFAFAQQTIVIPDNLFTQAGFLVKYATTPEKERLLRSFPPDKLVTRRKDGKLYYVYADAARCNCAYVGTPEAYAAYRNWTNIVPGDNAGDQHAVEPIDSDVPAPSIPADLGDSMDSILVPSFSRIRSMTRRQSRFRTALICAAAFLVPYGIIAYIALPL